MPATALENEVPSVASIYYLDTSAVMALAYEQYHRMSHAAIPQIQATRAQRLLAFVPRVRTAGGQLTSTVLALEELAAATCNESRALLAKQENSNWNELKKNRRDAKYTRVRDAAHRVGVRMLKVAIEALNRSGVKLMRASIDRGAEERTTMALAEAFQSTLSSNLGLDAMDALHIVTGHEYGATRFVSFDEAWKSVATISVCS